MYSQTLRQSWVEISLGALENNLNEIKQQLNGQEIIAVVKADAYGHGAVKIAKALESLGVKYFAVATIEEALELRHNGINTNILILSFVPHECFELLIANSFTPVIGRLESAQALSNAAVKLLKKDCGFMFAIDSGMGRIGYCVMTEEERKLALEEYIEMDSLPGIKASGIITHFSSADEEEREYTDTQIKNYKAFYEMLKSAGHTPVRAAANSAAIMVYPNALFDAARPGIILYGLYPSTYLYGRELALEPLMSVKSNIVNIKTVPEGRAISYGRKYVSDGERVIATIPLGYADGYSRALSGRAEVLVNGRRCPVAGNICMDQCMIDVSSVPDASVGTEVVIMGKQGEESITADELAEKLGTINYEIVCGFGLRLPKVYVE